MLGTIIVCDASPRARNSLASLLHTQGYAVRIAQNGDEVLTLLQEDQHVSLVLMDVKMADGFEKWHELRLLHNETQIVLTAEGPVPQSVLDNPDGEKPLKLLQKPILWRDLHGLLMVDQSLTNLGQPPQPNFLDFGETEPMQPFMLMIEGMIKQVGQTDFPVLLHGETGAGKEVLARQIHVCSRRARGRFVKVNCAALPTELVESELFGYEKGAFSGAFHQRPGLFETAHEGTILLDEIGDMDVRLQAKLLQVLQDGEFRRLGGRDLVKVDVRIMAATHQDLRQAIEDGRFREDLYYRLNVVTITIPPLRERKGEIIPLAESFLKKYSSGSFSPPPLTPSLCEAMLAYDWPGNVRELENVVRKLLVVRNPAFVAKELLSTKRKAPPSATHKVTAMQKPEDDAGNEVDAHHSTPLGRIKRMKEVAERDAMVSALRSTNWNRRRAAALLGIDYKALLYRLKKLGIAEEVS